jgi:iron complex transport system ATP-binding protein
MTELASRSHPLLRRGDARTQAATSAVAAFHVTVRRTRRLSSTFLRVTFGGESLRDFGVSGDTLDLRIKIVVPPRGGRGANLGELLAESSPDGWYQRWQALDPAARGAMRTYTVRHARCDSADPEIDVDFVMHDDQAGGSAPAAEWAAAARLGDALWLVGPNLHAAQCVTAGSYGGIEWRPGLAQRVLLAGDETAVPAISAIVEALPAHVTGHAVLEVPHRSDVQGLDTASGIDVVWLAREGNPHGKLLAESVRGAVTVPGWVGLGRAQAGQAAAGSEPEEIDIDATILWETPQRLALSGSAAASARPAGALPFYAWIAGEAAMVRELRRYLVRDVGMDRKQVAFMGYWRRGRTELA